MKTRYTAQEMREMATEAEVIEVPDQFCGHNMDTIAAMLRQAADMMEREEKRERKYEYGVIPHGAYFVYQTRAEADHKQAILEQAGFQYPIVRREVGAWEEVKDV